ncbi:MAG: helix-turn-helix transcriptional regulator, partial [Oscillospiraceae bacterium]
MDSCFSQNLVILRKERGLSQKKVAGDLHISQALLSHYEKGIRECGLDFVMKTANYFDVSCDFLLGRSKERNSSTKQKKLTGASAEATEESIILDAVTIVFAILKKINSKSLIKEVTHYLSCAVYTMFRTITHTKNSGFVLQLDKNMYAAVSSAKMTISKAQCDMI